MGIGDPCTASRTCLWELRTFRAAPARPPAGGQANPDSGLAGGREQLYQLSAGIKSTARLSPTWAWPLQCFPIRILPCGDRAGQLGLVWALGKRLTSPGPAAFPTPQPPAEVEATDWGRGSSSRTSPTQGAWLSHDQRE